MRYFHLGKRPKKMCGCGYYYDEGHLLGKKKKNLNHLFISND